MVSTCTISRQVLGTSVFTGHDFDDETDLSYMGARYYNGAIGRFISQDTWEGDLRNPQSLNKYTYGYNNPIIFVDPDGSKAEQSFILTLNSQHPVVRSLVLNEFEASAKGAVAGLAVGGATIVASGLAVAGGSAAVAAVPVVAANAAVQRAAFGGITNTAFRYYTDIQDGKVDNSLADYRTSFLVGAGANALAGGAGYWDTAKIAAGASVFEGLAVDGGVSVRDAALNVAGAVGGKFVAGVPAPLVWSKLGTNPTFHNFSEAIAGVVIQIGILEGVIEQQIQNEEDEERE